MFFYGLGFAGTAALVVGLLFLGIPDAKVFLFIVLVCVFCGIGLMMQLILYHAHSRIETPTLQVSNARPMLGERIKLEAEVEAVARVALTKVVAALSCDEEIRRARRAHEKPLVTPVRWVEATLAENLRLEPDGLHRLTCELTVPADAMQTFETHLAAVRWKAKLLVYVGPSVVRTVEEPLSVQPIRVK